MSISSKLKQREAVSLFLNLPEEIHDEIFLKLPAKSILVSRCVCKLFYNLLSKPNFIKNHVNRTNQSKSNPKLLFSHCPRGRHTMIYSVGIDYPSISSPSSECHGPVLLNYPSESRFFYFINFLGSCNGLVCLKINSFDEDDNVRGKFVYDYYYSILNPLTREYKEFRRPGCWYQAIYGFGYDTNNDDYKLVILPGYGDAGCFKIQVYKLRSDSWSSIQGTVNYKFGGPFKGSHGVFFNGALHWLGSITSQETSSQVIVCFDISNETMVDMPLPENIMPPTDYQGETYTNVGVWVDCICIAFICDSDRLDVWVMQEYGVKESWIKQFTSATTQHPWTWLSNPFWKPLWCFDNREILINNDRKELYLYDPATDRVRSVVVCDITTDYKRESYVESIVSLESGTYLEKPISRLRMGS